MRNPVTNLTTMLGTTDIEDWIVYECGLATEEERTRSAAGMGTGAIAMGLTDADLHSMWTKSPMSNVKEVPCSHNPPPALHGITIPLILALTTQSTLSLTNHLRSPISAPMSRSTPFPTLNVAALITPPTMHRITIPLILALSTQSTHPPFCFCASVGKCVGAAWLVCM